MKKTITKVDGTTETVEGTAEEIAEYERKLRGDVQEAPKPKGPGLLTDELQRFLDRSGGFYPLVFRPLEHTPECQISIASRGWWSVIPPCCTCGHTHHYTFTPSMSVSS